MSDQFYYFPYLPGELRIQIWQEALHEPRDLVVDYGKYNAYSMEDDFHGSLPIPALLHVNQESRRLSLNYFGCYFKNQLFTASHVKNFARALYRMYLNGSSRIPYERRKGGIFINPENDMIHMSSYTLCRMTLRFKQQTSHLQRVHIILDLLSQSEFHRRQTIWKIICRDLPRLVELVLSVTCTQDLHRLFGSLRTTGFRRELKNWSVPRLCIFDDSSGVSICGKINKGLWNRDEYRSIKYPREAVQSICVQSPFSTFSHEEIRLMTHERGNWSAISLIDFLCFYDNAELHAHGPSIIRLDRQVANGRRFGPRGSQERFNRMKLIYYQINLPIDNTIADGMVQVKIKNRVMKMDTSPLVSSTQEALQSVFDWPQFQDVSPEELRLCDRVQEEGYEMDTSQFPSYEESLQSIFHAPKYQDLSSEELRTYDYARKLQAHRFFCEFTYKALTVMGYNKRGAHLDISYEELRLFGYPYFQLFSDRTFSLDQDKLADYIHYTPGWSTERFWFKQQEGRFISNDFFDRSSTRIGAFMQKILSEAFMRRLYSSVVYPNRAYNSQVMCWY